MVPRAFELRARLWFSASSWGRRGWLLGSTILHQRQLEYVAHGQPQRGAGDAWGGRAGVARLWQVGQRASPKTALPNPSLKRSANGRPPGPGLRYAVHFLSPGPGGLPSSPA